MKIIFKDSVKITEKPVLRSIISAITQIQTTNKSSYFSVVSRSLSVKNYALLMMCEKGSHHLD